MSTKVKELRENIRALNNTEIKIPLTLGQLISIKNSLLVKIVLTKEEQHLINQIDYHTKSIMEAEKVLLKEIHKELRKSIKKVEYPFNKNFYDIVKLIDHGNWPKDKKLRGAWIAEMVQKLYSRAKGSAEKELAEKILEVHNKQLWNSPLVFRKFVRDEYKKYRGA